MHVQAQLEHGERRDQLYARGAAPKSAVNGSYNGFDGGTRYPEWDQEGEHEHDFDSTRADEWDNDDDYPYRSEADEEGESGDSSSIKPKPKAAALSSSRRDEEEQAATVDEYLKRGKWGASARMR